MSSKVKTWHRLWPPTGSGFALFICGAMLMSIAGVSSGAEPRTEHTFALAENEQSPPATLDDADLLIGTWQGIAFGQRFEENWNAPSAGSMVGMFKLYGDEGVAFYELMLITLENGSLSFKVKHFNPDFSAWEEQTEYTEFRFISRESDALHFDGVSFYQVDDNRLDAYLRIRDGDSVTEQKLQYRRVEQ